VRSRGYIRTMEVGSFDHVALWTAERDALAGMLTAGCGMHVISRTDAFTLVGGDARQGKVTLFAADGPRERGILERIVVRVPDLDDVRGRLEAAGYEVAHDGDELLLDGPDGVRLAVVGRPGIPVVDLDGVVLRVPDPEATASSLAELGLEREDGRLHVEDREVVLERGDGQTGGRPLLNHLAFLVESARRVEQEARDRGLEVEDVVDAPNTLAVFLHGPDSLRLEYVEHKPGFALE
jgi:catechol 2,3-dioxygenase-like lactoylglutathione lyase family enzyme